MLKNTDAKKQTGIVPIISLSLSMVVFALVIFLLSSSISSLKKENEGLRADIISLKNESSLNQQAVFALQKHVDENTAGMKGDVQNVKSRLDSILALYGGIEKLQASSADPNFSIASFDLKFFNSADYKYQSYTGTGTITTGDTQDSFLVLMKKTLKAGGAPTTKKIEYVLILVVDGTGTFATDDSSEGAVEKPEYDFEVFGNIRIIGNSQKPAS
jgi:hypothetical protein